VGTIKLVLVVAAVVLVSAAVPVAQGTSDSIPSRLTAVERKVTRLQRDMATAQRTLTFLQGCITAVRITTYGGLATEGYVYRNTAEGREFLTSALDFTDEGDQPSAIMATLKPECASQALARGASAVGNRKPGARSIPTLKLKPVAR
jgi:hypothetical protein